VNDRERRVARVFEVPVLVAALLVIPVVIIESSSSISDSWKDVASVTNWVIWLVFAAELIAFLVVTENRWHWLRTHPLEVVIVVLTPPFLPSSLQSLRALRLLRLVRLLRLAKLGRDAFSLQGLRYMTMLALLTVLIGGAAFASVEKKAHSTWDGVWWAITTMTTVGYGDISPETTEGRLIAIAVMLVGIGFIAVLTGAVAQRFLAVQVAAVEAEVIGEAETVDEVLSELRAVRERLASLETRVQRLGSRGEGK
jgi:voltage-gated potassium channel